MGGRHRGLHGRVVPISDKFFVVMAPYLLGWYVPLHFDRGEYRRRHHLCMAGGRWPPVERISRFDLEPVGALCGDPLWWNSQTLQERDRSGIGCKLFERDQFLDSFVGWF